MSGVLRVRDRTGAWRQLSVDQAVAEASQHLDRGDPASALNLLEKAVRLAPHLPAVRYLLGVAQIKQKNFALAIPNLEKALLSDDHNVGYLGALGEALMADRPLDAIPHLSRAVDLGSNNPGVYTNLSSLLLNLGKPEQALRICESSLNACGPHPWVMANQGLALQALARYEESLKCLQNAEVLLPGDYRLIVNIGIVLLDLGRPAVARDYLERAVALDPNGAIAHYNLGNVMLNQGRLADARDCLERAVALDPDGAAAHYNLGITLLLEGHYQAGFREYEWRWWTKNFTGRRRDFPQPVWDGGELAGRRILLYGEQGAGDIIQFVRYAEFARARGGRVILWVPQSMVRLMGSLADCEVSAQEAAPPDFDVHCSLLSLPLLAATDENSIPPPAKFDVPSEMKERWSELLGTKTGTRVGVVWAGSGHHSNDRNRSLACGLFAPLLEIPQLEWFSLQVGPTVAQLAARGVQCRIRDLAPELTDYAETAGALAQLDLVITVDTSVAHLAGSLGTPVWMLTPFAPDWRWLLDREDSPWYPSMRLFRQKVAGDWESVVRSVATALRQLVGAEPAGAPAVRRATRQTDIARWSNADNLDPAWNERARCAADFIPAGAAVLDLGCGGMALEGYLPPGCRYMPCDIVPRDERTLLCDFNEQPIPQPPGLTHITALGVLEYIHDWRDFLKQLRAFDVPVILSYCPTDFTTHLGRAALGWINHLSLQDLCDGFVEADFHLQSSLRPDSNQVLLRAVPLKTRLPVRRRVLVMSYKNCGNFGDRLGFHVINSLMPAGAEVHHGHFQPWEVPPGDFDLLVLGIGNSVFHPILTDQLIELAGRIPRSVGVFGTQYREAIDPRRMSQLLDRLTVWFARYEEDLLLYGAGRQNAMHLGDWLISAFPMARWTRDETLHVGPEVWKDLPLDRTIQSIQQYRTVVSERIHPLLCALTSAERVAYTEQREDGSGKPSGKFRSLLIDVFGRTWPESNFFEFSHDAVTAYRARTMAVMSVMPQLFNELLGLDTDRSAGRAPMPTGTPES